MNVDVLVISSIYDFSTDLVVQELEKRKVSYFRLNKENFSDYRVTIDIQNKLLEILVDGNSYIVSDTTNSVYYRQPIFLRNTPNQSLSIDEQLISSQWMGFLRSLTIFDKAKWLNPPESTYLGETKAYQLSIAREIGFNIPTTLIGNNAARFKELGSNLIIKSLDTILLKENNDCLFTYSTVKNSIELNDGNVAAVPFTAQEYISPKIDVRVTVIGNVINAVKITKAGVGIEEDWRTVEREKIEYTDIMLPNEIEQYCFDLLSRLKLNFGAIDLIIRNDEYIFIEINPTGEWGWLTSTERKFDKYLADWLQDSK